MKIACWANVFNQILFIIRLYKSPAVIACVSHEYIKNLECLESCVKHYSTKMLFYALFYKDDTDVSLWNKENAGHLSVNFELYTCVIFTKIIFLSKKKKLFTYPNTLYRKYLLQKIKL